MRFQCRPEVAGLSIVRSTPSDPERRPGDRMTEAFEFDRLGFLRTFALEDPRSREIARLAVEEVGKMAIDAAGWAWSTIQKSLSRPPSVKVSPPPAAAAIPVPVPQQAASPEPLPMPLGERAPGEASLDDRPQSHVPETV